MIQNKEMDKVYAPKEIEEKLYREWEESGAFLAHRIPGKNPFTIVMPPPNITGQLHIGHALDTLPHSPGLFLMFSVLGLTHKKAYKHVFFTSTISPITVVLIATAICVLFGL